MTATALSLVAGIAWTTAYVAIIVRGFRDRTYGMPFVALALNITWEFTYAFVEPSPYALQIAINIVWFLFDIAILVAYFKYGRPEFSLRYDERYFVPWSVAFLAGCLAVNYLVAREFDGHPVDAYSALFSNVVMSLAFLGMLGQRGNAAGQSLTIAVSKGIGTAAATVVVVEDTRSVLALALGVCAAVLDTAYALLLRRHTRAATAAAPPRSSSPPPPRTAPAPADTAPEESGR
ncbi:hypothetical protein ABZ568_32595 [Streptomyces olindensis]|uniref:Uncharacterized protein n=1 Tax=Streptomyces olindensis TaxID=358823 RepID=A0ABV2Y471_9ACTN|nr:hypothetical protein DF19_00380 [Streptomyces olindensis]